MSPQGKLPLFVLFDAPCRSARFEICRSHDVIGSAVDDLIPGRAAQAFSVLVRAGTVVSPLPSAQDLVRIGLSVRAFAPVRSRRGDNSGARFVRTAFTDRSLGRRLLRRILPNPGITGRVLAASRFARQSSPHGFLFLDVHSKNHFMVLSTTILAFP